MKFTIPFEFEATLWKADGNSGWHFVSIPIVLSQEIRHLFQKEEEGWGRLPVMALIRDTSWDTAIWFDTKNNTYLLPIKSEIRKKENISVGTIEKITIKI
jgi:hypothetical protein